MKTIQFIIIFAGFIFLVTLPAHAQKKELTTKFRVEGVCDQCKKRIENAAYLNGIKHCEWDKETEILTVVYNSDKVSLDAIHKSIAKAGHETEKEEADSVAYSKLPKCCAYKGNVHKH
ncbi:MAG: cation transporter [Bacteroidales bacterium]|nr:cation transporter [Bacteroidales bacterium]